MDLSREEIDKILYELHRIGNAVEILAMHADERFFPLDPSLRIYRKELGRKASTKPQDPR